MSKTLSGGKILAQSLKMHGVDRVFCVAGESYLPVMDALLDHPEIEVITCRQESGATFMAESYAQLTGKPAVAFVTRGPGACNGSIGIHAAKQSSTPVILFVGLINSKDRGRESFQEFDMTQMFASLSKHSAVIDTVERVADMTAHAFSVSMSGRKGPVVLGLPEEVLTNEIPSSPTLNVIPHPRQTPTPQDIDRIAKAIESAEKPIVLVGGSLWRDEDCAAMKVFVKSTNLPVMCSLRRQDIFDHNHDCYIGEMGFGPNPALVARVKEADTIFILGTRIDEITAQGYTLFEPHHKIIHVYSTSEEFGRTYIPDIAVQAHIGETITALSARPIDGSKWQDWTTDGRKAYVEWTNIPNARTSDWDGSDMHQIFRQLRGTLPDDAIITSDAGNFSGWVHRYLRFGRPGRGFAPVCGAMGYAVPTAVGSSIAAPDRVVVGICGDGGFMMTGHEIATAMHHGAKPILIVCNNNMFGTIRMHQDRDFTGRPHKGKQGGTVLTNPDFVKLAESYGAFGARVEHEDQFAGVWAAAVDSGTPALIEIMMDPRQISTTTRL